MEHTTPERKAPARSNKLAAIYRGARFEAPTGVDDVEHTGHRPAGGSVGANQYGTFKVRMPSDKQVAFVRSLLAKRVIPPNDGRMGEFVALAAFEAGTANLRQTSDLITWLKNLPETPQASGQVRVASDKQVALIGRLTGERVNGEYALRIALQAADVTQVAELPIKIASDLIDALFALPKKEHSVAVREAAGVAAKIESGLYEKDGVIYRVYFGQQSRQQLAKVYKDGDWAYAGKAERFVSAADAMSPERIKEFGAVITHTHCIICGLSLDDPESVDRGIGPVCYGRLS